MYNTKSGSYMVAPFNLVHNHKLIMAERLLFCKFCDQ